MSAAEVARLSRQPFSYSPVGLTRGPSYPPGFHRLEVRQEVGRGDAAFRHAVETLMGWRMQARAGLRVVASAGLVAEGGVVRMMLGPVRIPCRVVWVDADESCLGYAYGTLPGHPEAGEEAFLLSRDGDAVVLTVRAYSRPGRLYTRLAGPAGRATQRWMVGRYADALRSPETRTDKD
jgi:uncharacterized protein (UPF0548 family)